MQTVKATNAEAGTEKIGKEENESIFSNIYMNITVGKRKCDVLVWVT